MLGTTQSVDLLMHANPPLQISAVPVPLVQEGISCDAVCFLFLTVIRFFFGGVLLTMLQKVKPRAAFFHKAIQLVKIVDGLRFNTPQRCLAGNHLG